VIPKNSIKAAKKGNFFSKVKAPYGTQQTPSLAGRPVTQRPRHKGDAVNHPKHYNTGAVEVIDAIEAWDLGFNDGNAVKYIARAGKKDWAKTIEDLKKARWYLDRHIANLEKRQGDPDAEE
jgi:Protein of unknwon function (DUF3310)